MKRTQLIALLLPLVVILGTTASFAQYENHLILKKGYKNLTHYLTGDSIRFQRNYLEVPTIGIIEAIGEDFLVIRSQVFPLKEINTVYQRRPFPFKAGGKALQIAGPSFLGIAAFNALYNSIRPIWTVGNLITGGSFFLAGILMPLLQTRKFELGHRYYLRIVPSDPELLRKASKK